MFPPSLPHRPTLPTSSGSYHTLLAFPLTTGFLQLQHLPLTAVPFPGLSCTLATTTPAPPPPPSKPYAVASHKWLLGI